MKSNLDLLEQMYADVLQIRRDLEAQPEPARTIPAWYRALTVATLAALSPCSLP